MSIFPLGRLSRDFLWQLLDRFGRIIISLFVGVLFTRYLGAEQYGTYSLVVAFVTFVHIALPFGTNQIGLVEILNVDTPGLYLGRLLSFRIVMLLFCALILGIVFRFNESFSWYYIIGFFSLVFRFNDIFDIFFQAKGLNVYSSLSSLFTSILTNSLKICLIIFDFPLEYFFYLLVIEAIFYSAISYSFIEKLKVKIVLDFNLTRILSILIKSWPYLLSAIAVFAYMRIDMFMLNYFLNRSSVGHFSLAVSLSEIYYIIPTIILATIFNKMSIDFKEDKDGYIRRLKSLFRLFFFAGLSIGLLAQMFSSIIVIYIFGEEFSSSVDVLKIHIWTGIFVSYGMLVSRHLLLEGKYQFDVSRILVGLGFNLLLNYWFIPLYGIIGAAIASFLSQFIANVLLLWFVKSGGELRFYQLPFNVKN